MLSVNLDARDTVQQHNLNAKYVDPFDGACFRYYKYNDGTANRAAVVGDGGVFF